MGLYQKRKAAAIAMRAILLFLKHIFSVVLLDF